MWGDDQEGLCGEMTGKVCVGEMIGRVCEGR